jgi:ABC-2 type transport system permease protein
VISLDVFQNSVAELHHPNRQRDAVGIAAVSALISLILGIVSSAGEYGHGTISHTFLVTPVRERVVAAKLASAALGGAALAVISAAFAWGFAALLLSARSVPLHLGSRVALYLLLGTIGAAALTGALGVGLGAVLRRQTAAVVLALVWLLVAEPLLAIAGVNKYAPGHAVAAVVEAGANGSDVLNFWPGLALALAYTVGLAVVGAVVVERTDVT